MELYEEELIISKRFGGDFCVVFSESFNRRFFFFFEKNVKNHLNNFFNSDDTKNEFFTRKFILRKFSCDDT